MRYKGQMVDRLGLDDLEFTSQVTDAVVTNSEIRIDWTEDGDKCHLRAYSNDGVTFEGTFGFPTPDKTLTMSLKKYEAADKSLLLIGCWWDRIDGTEDSCIFRLDRVDLPRQKTKRKQSKAKAH